MAAFTDATTVGLDVLPREESLAQGKTKLRLASVSVQTDALATAQRGVQSDVCLPPRHLPSVEIILASSSAGGADRGAGGGGGGGGDDDGVDDSEALALLMGGMTREQAAAVPHVRSQGCQTEAPTPWNGVAPEFVDAVSLAAFVQRASALVLAELESAETSVAFDNWDASRAGDDAALLTLVHSLSHADCVSHGMTASTVSWSSSGSLLAVGYGHDGHSAWCEHRGAVALWSVSRRTLQPTRADRLIELASCVTQLAFHPRQPGLLAVGTHAGDVCVLDTAAPSESALADATGAPLAADVRASVLHSEPISGLAWMLDETGRDYALLSTARDGRVLVWRGRAFDASAQRPRLAYCLYTSRLGSALSPLGAAGLAVRDSEAQTFVVATDAGVALVCSLHRGIGLASAVDSSSLPSPVVLAYSRSRGSLLAIACAEPRGTVFAAACSDASVAVQGADADAPALLLEPLARGFVRALAWAPGRPAVLLAGTSDGSLLAYEVGAGSAARPAATAAVSGGAALTALATNARAPDLLACTDASGVARVWRLSPRLARAQARDEAALAAAFAGV